MTISSKEVLERTNKKTIKNKVITRKNKEFKEKYLHQINYTHFSNNQITSIGTQLIPFLEHNDANRTLMGTNMQKQAVPLNNKELPILQTGTEKEICEISSFNVLSRNSGVTVYKGKNKLIINEIQKEKSIKKINSSLKGKLTKKSFFNKKNVNKYKEKIYHLEQLQLTTQHSYKRQRPIISERNWIKKGEIITNNSSTKKGKLALGKNLLIGYMCWEGYNFEDAIIINESVIKNDKLTSTHIKRYKTFLINNEIGEVRMVN